MGEKLRLDFTYRDVYTNQVHIYPYIGRISEPNSDINKLSEVAFNYEEVFIK